MHFEIERRDLAEQLRELGRLIRAHWWIVAICVVLTAGGAFAYAQSRPTGYQAQAKLLLEPDDLGASLTDLPASITDPVRESATDLQLVTLPAVASRVMAQLSKGDAAAARTASVSTSAVGDSNLMTISVSAPTAAGAARVANAVANEYVSFRTQINKQRVERILAPVKAELATDESSSSADARAETGTLHGEVQRLELLRDVQNGDAQVVEAAVPPPLPQPTDAVRDTILGLLLGAVLGIGLAVLRDRLDRRITSEGAVRTLFPDVPIIGTIPDAGRGGAAEALTAERFHLLTTNLRAISEDGGFRSLLVTSAMPREGKSTTALNLALALRDRGQPALLVEADMRRADLSHGLGIRSRGGFSELLAGRVEIGEAVLRARVSADGNRTGPRAMIDGVLTIVPAGPLPPNLHAMLGERTLNSILQQAGTFANPVIVDGPPLGLFGDMAPVARAADGTIVVVRLGHSRVDQVRRFAEQLETASIKPVGIVVVGAEAHLASYRSYYG